MNHKEYIYAKLRQRKGFKKRFTYKLRIVAPLKTGSVATYTHQQALISFRDLIVKQLKSEGRNFSVGKQINGGFDDARGEYLEMQVYAYTNKYTPVDEKVIWITI